MSIKLIALIALLLFTRPAHAVVDSSATAPTVALYNTLNTTGPIRLGLHEFYWWGSTGWDTMDTYAITGKFPKVAEWDMDFDITDLDGDQKYLIQRFHHAGGINVINWHMDNPMTDCSGDCGAWDATGTITRILPGGADRTAYVEKVALFADFLKSLDDDNGGLIPIIVRPLHENDGGWFWWGTTVTNDTNYVALWRDFVNLTRDTNGVHNVLYEYSPQVIGTYTTYNGTRYPGDDYVDICGISVYSNDDDLSGPMGRYNTTAAYALVAGKPFVIAEGFRDLATYPKSGDNFWTTYFNTIQNATTTRKAAYVLFWGTHSDNPDVSYGPVVERDDEGDYFAMTNMTNVTTIVPPGMYYNGVRLR